jgi:hypothetical protein
MTQLRASGLLKGELLELLSMLPLRHLSSPMLRGELIVKKGDLMGKAFSILHEQRLALWHSLSLPSTPSSASLSARAAWSSASLTRRAALSYATTTSRADVSAASIATIWEASTAVATTCAWVTSASSVGTSMLPREKSCRNKTQEE